MSIPQRPQGNVNPSQPPTEPTFTTANQTPCTTVLATLRAAARDAQVTRGALAVLLWFARESDVWLRFSVTDHTSAEIPRLHDQLAISIGTVKRALKLLVDRGYLEERKPRNARPGQREARLLLAVR